MSFYSLAKNVIRNSFGHKEGFPLSFNVHSTSSKECHAMLSIMVSLKLGGECTCVLSQTDCSLYYKTSEHNTLGMVYLFDQKCFFD